MISSIPFIIFAILAFSKISLCFNFTEFLLNYTNTSRSNDNETATAKGLTYVSWDSEYVHLINETERPFMVEHLLQSLEKTLDDSAQKHNYRSKARDGNYMSNSQSCLPCGVSLRNRIVGGREANIREFPWTVDIKKGGVQHCGGAIINRESILTAAHCIKGQDVTKFKVVAMVSNVLDPDALKLQIKSSVSHPKFDSETYDYDVAIMFLVEPLPKEAGIIFICLPDPSDDPTGQTAIVSGWGALKETANVAPERLRKLPVPVVTNDECQEAEGLKDQHLTDRMMCAGYLEGAMDACTGDSGGPLVWEQDGVYKLVGIVSWGIGCARPQYYGVYTRVTSVLSWIKENMKGEQC